MKKLFFVCRQTARRNVTCNLLTFAIWKIFPILTVFNEDLEAVVLPIASASTSYPNTQVLVAVLEGKIS